LYRRWIAKSSETRAEEALLPTAESAFRTEAQDAPKSKLRQAARQNPYFTRVLHDKAAQDSTPATLKLTVYWPFPMTVPTNRTRPRGTAILGSSAPILPARRPPPCLDARAWMPRTDRITGELKVGDAFETACPGYRGYRHRQNAEGMLRALRNRLNAKPGFRAQSSSSSSSLSSSA
jgi:hypothetical protein